MACDCSDYSGQELHMRPKEFVFVGSTTQLSGVSRAAQAAEEWNPHLQGEPWAWVFIVFSGHADVRLTFKTTTLVSSRTPTLSVLCLG